MKLLRKRYIPNEVVDISGDEVLYKDDELMVTRWLPINKRADIGSGISYVFLKEGYKISKFYDNDGNFAYWYCDIIEYRYEEAEDTHIFTDLLLDLKIYKDGHYEVLDMDELVEAYNKKMITMEQVLKAFKSLTKLHEMIKNEKFPPDICNKY